MSGDAQRYESERCGTCRLGLSGFCRLMDDLQGRFTPACEDWEPDDIDIPDPDEPARKLITPPGMEASHE